jgi:hypothetical protein
VTVDSVARSGPLRGLVISRPSGGAVCLGQGDALSVAQVVDLAMRTCGSIAVTLIWDGSDETLRVVAYDGLTDEKLVIPVSGDEAAEVYRHPFAHTARSIKTKH